MVVDLIVNFKNGVRNSSSMEAMYRKSSSKLQPELIQKAFIAVTPKNMVNKFPLKIDTNQFVQIVATINNQVVLIFLSVIR